MKNIKLAAIFSDNMVLQRDKCIKIFGECEDVKDITISLGDKNTAANIDDGKFTATLPPFSATRENELLTLTVKADDIIKTFKNIAVGEVWLAGGQSNMELELRNCKNGDEVLKRERTNKIRFYYTQKNAYMDEKFFRDEENTAWECFGDDGTKYWSAVGYFFAENVVKNLDVTVGIIGCNWGGTSASAWMSRESLSYDIDLQKYIADYDDFTKGKTETELNNDYIAYQNYHAEWEKRSAVFYSENPDATWAECLEACGENKYPGPHAPMNPYHAGALYESMIKRIVPYTLKGFIYYQGESDDHRAESYYKLLTALINQWRTDWSDDTLPFIITQLPMHRYAHDPDYKNWCIIREAQYKTYRTIKNTGLAVIINCGEWNEIHPKEKETVGYRLSLQALHLFYDRKDIKAFSPTPEYLFFNPDSVTIYFKDTYGGFKMKDSSMGLVGFEISSDNEDFFTATAEIISENAIKIHSEKVKNPKFVRYLWTNFGDVNIFNTENLPIMPFRGCF